MKPRSAAVLLTVGLLCVITADVSGDRQSPPLAATSAPEDWFDLKVKGGQATLDALGIPADERAMTLSLLARAINDRESRVGTASGRVTQAIAEMAVADSTRETLDIPAPLDGETWRQMLALRPDDDLFGRLLIDRNALLVAAGLMATDPSIRALVSRDRDLLRFLYKEGACPFIVVARSLSARDGRVVAPGGAGADAIWQSLAGSPVSRPAAFIRSLLTKDQGRLAWYFDTIAGLDDNRLAAAWPQGLDNKRRADAEALYAIFRESIPEWRINEQPFRRSVADAWSILNFTDVTDGVPAAPNGDALWQLLFDTQDVSASDARRLENKPPAAISMLTLLRATSAASTRDRRNRFEMFRLAQRVFSGRTAADLPDMAIALGGYARFRALLLSLERMGITRLDTWALTVSAARNVSDHADDAREAIASHQGALALVDRMRHVRTIDVNTADTLLRALSEAVQRGNQVVASVSRWITESLVPALPALERPDAWTGETAYESTILQALAGPLDRRRPKLEWEELTYTVDIVAAEHERLRTIRGELPSPGLDAAIKSGDRRQLAAALTALVYATALGDPQGGAALSRDVGTRHDFGWDSSALMRQMMLWAPPEDRQGIGPWRVQGALLGLDLALARLTLRRIADQEMPLAPTLSLNDFATLTRTAVAMVPIELQDRDRDEIAAAIARGRQRVASAGSDPRAIDQLAGEIKMSPVARQLIPWIAARQPEAIGGLFSLRDVLWLGKPALSPSQLDAWGMVGDGFDGRVLTRMATPAPWEDFAGRPDAGQMATQAPDLVLRLAEETARLKLPAMLIPSMLGFAIEDYWHDVQARFADDWPRMTRQAAALAGSRIEDYVAALTANGPLRRQ